MKSILFIPGNRRGEGTGHLARCGNLIRELDRRGWKTALFRQEPGLSPGPFVPRETEVVTRKTLDFSPDFVVLDNKTTSLEHYREMASSIGGFWIALDEGGPARESVPLTVDSLWGGGKISPPNRYTPYTRGGEEKRKFTGVFQKVLISFGGEDKAGLSPLLVNSLLRHHLFDPGQLTLVEGPGFEPGEWPEGVKILGKIENLAGLMREYDLLFTHYGLSCFEALEQGVPVILINPTPYHHYLSRIHGLPRGGVKKPSYRKIRRLLNHPSVLKEPMEKWQEFIKTHREGLPEILEKLEPEGTAFCPVCSRAGKGVSRFPGRSYFRCPGCGLFWMTRFSPRLQTYGEEYFFDQYARQYGKTYLEDFNHIKAMSEERLSIIEKISSSSGVLLDLGCAYGPFLKAAQERGWEPEGVEISPGAAAYVKDKLGFPVYMEDLSVFEVSRRYDLVTMWYVIEHFPRLGEVLRKVKGLLKKGGVFAFSTPNARGISGRRSLEAFLRSSPGDHFTVMSPRSAGRVLKAFGFKVAACRITGHHPERMVKGIQGKGFFRSFLLFLSRIFRLGDTFEIYAVKVDDVE